MAITNTYVTSVNGKTGDLPYELDQVKGAPGTAEYEQIFGQVTHHHGVVILDAADFRLIGERGNTIPEEMRIIADTMRPMILERIYGFGDNYLLKVESGISYDPVK